MYSFKDENLSISQSINSWFLSQPFKIRDLSLCGTKREKTEALRGTTGVILDSEGRTDTQDVLWLL